MDPTTTTRSGVSAPEADGTADPALAFWRGHLDARIAELLGEPVAWSRACAPKPVPDDTAKLVLQGKAGPRAVLVGSAAGAPDLAARHAGRAKAAADSLPEDLAAVVLRPQEQGMIDGRSYVVWPYRRPPGEGRLARWRWRSQMADPVGRWLLEANRATLQPIPAEDRAAKIAVPLSALQGMEGISRGCLTAAEAASGRFSDGGVEPVHVLMHNDLWTGNVLAPGKSGSSGPYPFTIIDWAGAETAGYPCYDLARWAESVRMKPSAYRRALAGHAAVLGCEVGAMRDHLMVALGHLAMHLEGFAPQRFVRLADECLERLDAALGRAGDRIT